MKLIDEHHLQKRPVLDMITGKEIHVQLKSKQIVFHITTQLRNASILIYSLTIEWPNARAQ